MLDWQVEQRARVLYVDAELDLDDLKGRLNALGPNADDLRVISFDDLFNRGVELPDSGCLKPLHKRQGSLSYSADTGLFRRSTRC